MEKITMENIKEHWVTKQLLEEAVGVLEGKKANFAAYQYHSGKIDGLHLAGMIDENAEDLLDGLCLIVGANIEKPWFSDVETYVEKYNKSLEFFGLRGDINE